MKIIPSVISFVAILAFAPCSWGVDNPAPASSASTDSGSVSAETPEKGAQTTGSSQSEWEAAAPQAPAKSGIDSMPAAEKTVKADAKGAPVKTAKAVTDTAGALPQAAKAAVKTAPAKTGKAATDTTAARPQVAKAEPKTAEDFKKIGDQFAKKGQTDKAMAAYKQCIEKAGDDSTYGKIVKMLADYSQAKKLYADAAKYYAMIKGKNSELPAFKITYGRSLQMSGKNAEAIDLLEPLLADTKLKIDLRKEILKILGDAYFKTDMTEKAVALYGRYLKAGGMKTADMVFLVAFSLEASSPMKAKIKYEENIKSFPADYRNYLHLSIILSKNKATAQRAAALVKKASDLAGKSPAAWLEIGKAYGHAGKADDELAACQTCLKMDPSNLQAKSRIGAILLKKDMTSDAIAILEEAYKQAPDSVGPMISLGNAYLKTGKNKEAIDLLVKAKAAKPKDAAIRKLLFEAYRATGQDQQALEEIKATIDLKRDNESLLAYGKLLLKMGKFEEAGSVMEDIRSTAPDNIEALMTLAMALRGQKKLDAAIDIYKEVSSIDSKAAAPLFERAEVYLVQSKTKWAEQFYQRALAADPKMALAELGLAKLAMAYKNRQGYLDHLDKASAMDPNNPIIKKEIENSQKPAGNK